MRAVIRIGDIDGEPWIAYDFEEGRQVGNRYILMFSTDGYGVVRNYCRDGEAYSAVSTHLELRLI